MTTRRIMQAAALLDTLGRALAGAALLVAAALLVNPAHAAEGGAVTLSKEDKACLECHARPGARKALDNGESLSLYVSAKDFAASVHHNEGCEGCHSQIDNRTHGREKTAIASKRAFAREQMETCRDCHKMAVKQYEDSVHAVLVGKGSEKAPLCADCHNPHTTRSAKDAPAGQATGAVQCEQCHRQVTQAFAASVHGQAGDEALECKDCHRTHNIQAASAGTHLRGQCVSCHKDETAGHAKWLPNAGRHLEAVACAACHTPGTTRRVDLRLYEGAPGQKAVEKAGVPQFVKLASTANGAGLDGRALWSLLQDLNREATDSRTFVRGRLEVRTGVESHSLAKGQALKDCTTCHRAGAAAFQAVTISVIGGDGRPVRHAASQGILNSLESLGAVGGFYQIGSNRIVVLDVLLVVALAAGILVPGGHLAMKLVMARRRRQAAAAAVDGTD